jgi:hypothetical protein
MPERFYVHKLLIFPFTQKFIKHLRTPFSIMRTRMCKFFRLFPYLKLFKTFCRYQCYHYVNCLGSLKKPETAYSQVFKRAIILQYTFSSRFYLYLSLSLILSLSVFKRSIPAYSMPFLFSKSILPPPNLALFSLTLAYCT